MSQDKRGNLNEGKLRTPPLGRRQQVRRGEGAGLLVGGRSRTGAAVKYLDAQDIRIIKINNTAHRSKKERLDSTPQLREGLTRPIPYTNQPRAS